MARSILWSKPDDWALLFRVHVLLLFHTLSSSFAFTVNDLMLGIRVSVSDQRSYNLIVLRVCVQ